MLACPQKRGHHAKSGMMKPGPAPWRYSFGVEHKLRLMSEVALEIRVSHASFEEWWDPYLLGVGPAGRFVAALSPEGRAEIEGRCRELLPDPPFEITARAWAARGVA